eukprot:11160316-Lingulodinium_polyedra.AAC.1
MGCAARPNTRPRTASARRPKSSSGCRTPLGGWTRGPRRAWGRWLAPSKPSGAAWRTRGGGAFPSMRS